MTAESVSHISHLDSFRQALSRDPEKLRRFEESIAAADRVPPGPDDVDEIARLLNGPS
jgi:hypothetical protein